MVFALLIVLDGRKFLVRSIAEANQHKSRAIDFNFSVCCGRHIGASVVGCFDGWCKKNPANVERVAGFWMGLHVCEAPIGIETHTLRE